MESGIVRPKVCRNLFGSPSTEEREQMKSLIKETFREEKGKAMMKYNFDFERDLPLEGKFEWTVAEPECPSFYTKGYAPSKFRKRDICVTRKRRLSFSESDSDHESDMCNTLTTSLVGDDTSRVDLDVQTVNDSGFSSQENSLVEEPSSQEPKKPLVQTQLGSK